MENYTKYQTITNKQLERWWNNKKNVIIYGRRGCGKTSIIEGYWKSLGIKYAIFSGSTLDPWTDLVGVPRTFEKDGKHYLAYALPETIPDDIEAIFIDEYNRSHAKVRNAVMELTQFKSINGRKFKNLKVVWVAANPPDTDDNYDVDIVDPAQEDRFHVILTIDDKPQKDFFEKKFGESMASGAIRWYNNVPTEIRNKISPRRLEYALDMFVETGGNLKEVLPYAGLNLSALKNALSGEDLLRDIKESLNRPQELKKIFSTSKFETSLSSILGNYEACEAFVENAPVERVLSVAESEPCVGLLIAESKNKDLNEAISNKRSLGVPTTWFDSASNTARGIRDLHDKLENIFNSSPISEITIPPIGDVAPLLKSETLEDIIDDIQISKNYSIFDMSETSAINILELFKEYRIISRVIPESVYEECKSLYFSAIYKLYNKKGNAIVPGFYVQGFEGFVSIFRVQSSVDIGKGRSSNGFPAPRIGGSRSSKKGMGVTTSEIL